MEAVMPMFQTRPRIIEAFLFQGQKATDSGLPQWYLDEILAARLRLGAKESVIDTPNGPMQCRAGDWLVRDGRGIYPVRKDIFDTMYEPLPPGAAAQPETPARAAEPDPDYKPSVL
jgi:hypothetical protein